MDHPDTYSSRLGYGPCPYSTTSLTTQTIRSESFVLHVVNQNTPLTVVKTRRFRVPRSVPTVLSVDHSSHPVPQTTHSSLNDSGHLQLPPSVPTVSRVTSRPSPPGVIHGTPIRTSLPHLLHFLGLLTPVNTRGCGGVTDPVPVPPTLPIPGVTVEEVSDSDTSSKNRRASILAAKDEEEGGLSTRGGGRGKEGEVRRERGRGKEERERNRKNGRERLVLVFAQGGDLQRWVVYP